MKIVLPVRWRLILGGLTLPAVFLLHGQLESLTSLILIFLASRLVGYRLWWRRLLPMALMLLFFYLLIPKGLVWWRVQFFWGWEFRLTEGAFTEGLLTVAFLIQLLLLSGFTVDKNLQLPGRWGRQFSQVLLIYNLLLQASKKFSFKQPFSSLDQILLEVETAVRQPPSPSTALESEVGQADQQRRRPNHRLRKKVEADALTPLLYALLLPLPCWLLVAQGWLALF